MNHSAVTAELTRHLPPQNPYFAGEQLHYYWLFHVWPSIIITLTGVPAVEAVRLSFLPTIALFVASVGLWLRCTLPASRSIVIVMLIGLFAYSFIGPLFFIKQILPDLAQKLPMVSSREYSFLSHSWFRDCLYEPHALSALSLLVCGLVVAAKSLPQRSWLAGLALGTLLGGACVTDAFIGFLGLLYFAIIYLWRFLTNSSTRFTLLVAVHGTLAVLAGAIALGVFPLTGRSVGAFLHPAAKLAPIYLTIELGPIFALGASGLLLAAVARRDTPFLSLLILATLPFIIGFSLSVPEESNIVLRKSLKLIQLPLLAFTAMLLDYIRTLYWSHIAHSFIGGLTLLGSSTLVSDNFLYINAIATRYPPVSVISRDEIELLQWIRANLPPDAVCQIATHDRIFGPTTPMYVEAVSERSTYYGNDELPKMYKVPAALIVERNRNLQTLFAATSPDSVAEALSHLPGVYLIVDELAIPAGFQIADLEARGTIRHVYRVGQYSLKLVVR